MDSQYETGVASPVSQVQKPRPEKGHDLGSPEGVPDSTSVLPLAPALLLLWFLKRFHFMEARKSPFSEELQGNCF